MNSIANSVDHCVNGLRRVLIAGLISLSLWGAFAVAPAYAADAGDFYENERGSLQTTERYDQIQTEKGGMNNFDAVDPRRNANEAKAQTLLDTAKRRKAQASDPLEPAREAVNDIKENVAGTTDELLSKADNRLETVSNQVDNATDRLGEKMSDAANRLGEAVDNTNERIGNRVEQALDD